MLTGKSMLSTLVSWPSIGRDKYMSKIYSLILVFGILIFTPNLANAASVTFGYESDIVQVGDTFKVQIILNTEGKQVNAFETKVKYSKEEFKFLKSIEADSVINFWIEKPHLVEDGTLFLSGITPGGVNGRDIEILTLEFEVIKEGVGTVNLEDHQILLNDGLGTLVETKIVPLSLNILGQSDLSSPNMKYIDTEPPEPFSPMIVSDEDVFGGKKFLVFSTEDKGSGVDYFEIKEGEFSEYEIAVSPYEIKDQTLNKSIFVKAIDLEKNEYIAIIYPQNIVPWYQTLVAKTAILVLCLIILLPLIYRFFVRRA